MLRWRLLLGFGIVATLGILCWLDFRAARPGVWLLPLALAVMVSAGDELMALARARGIQAARAVVAAGLVLIGFANFAAHTGRATATLEPFGWVAAAMVLALLLLLGVELIRFRTPGIALARLAVGALSLLYVGLPMSFLMQLRFLDEGRAGVAALVSLIAVVKVSDIGAYAVGRLVGRRRLAPRVSPGKTLEGALGGVLSGVAAAALVFGWLVPRMNADAGAGPGWGWLVFAVLVSLAGLVGDLAESLLKRDAGRKDSSTWMPGFGGVLDVLDSLLVAAPVAYLCWRFGLVGA
jgi:phosphatidate cytidylyltransferase